MRSRGTFLFSSLLLVAVAGRAVTDQAIELRNLGLAQLENEKPADAETTFARLVELVPDDPLGHANLAIAFFRQQQNDEALAAIDAALELDGGRADLLAIKAEILIWVGRHEEGLALLEQAAEAAPDDLEVLYTLYRHGTTLRSEDAEEATGRALERLTRLRPENLVVLLQAGQRAIAAGDRTEASRIYLRVGELLWQADELAHRVHGELLEALEEGDLESARRPALMLENVLKSLPMFKSSLVELFTGIQGIPVARFVDEAPPTAFGDPLEVRFSGRPLEASGKGSRALVVVDLDGDHLADIVRGVGGEAPQLEIRLAAARWQARSLESPLLEDLLAVDLDNDGNLDLVGSASGAGTVVWQGTGGGRFAEASERFGLAEVFSLTVAPFDFDQEGDLDLVVAHPHGTESDGRRGFDLFRNTLEGPLESVGSHSFPQLRRRDVTRLLPSDLDRDGDIDLAIAHREGLTWLDNLRQGRFANRTAPGGLRDIEWARDAVSADLDNDGLPELIFAGERLRVMRNTGGFFEESGLDLPEGEVHALLAFDADNDGRLDLATAGGEGLRVLTQRSEMMFESAAVEEGPSELSALGSGDLDGDGDLDLVASGPGGLWIFDNEGGNRNHWLRVRLRGLQQGNDKNNVFGRGATAEVRIGRAYQFREVKEPVTHFGLGRHRRAGKLRVVWNNGVPQNRLDPEADQLVVEEQILKGSCPFLYTWTGERIEFVTDLLWGAPLGLPLAEGVWAGADPLELVKVEGARPLEGVYDLRITEELWEAAFFDHVRLWVVDHPGDVEVASSLRIVPGETIDDRVMGTRRLRPVITALDARGLDVTSRVSRRDAVYAGGFPRGPYQGVTTEPWTFTFDLGEAPGTAVRLHLDGWIFPADASLNLAIAQRDDIQPILTRLEVETADGWRPLVSPMGHPAGKTKTMVVDTPPLPRGAHRLRIKSSRWLFWDRIAWSTAPADDEPVVRARLAPRSAELRFRGFSEMIREAPNAPHRFDYARVRTESPWLPFPGRYTRFGNVKELVAEADDRMVILAPGDELRLLFDTSPLEPPPSGWRRTVFLESLGWDKDADRNTWQSEHVEPLPFRAMSGYPYPPSEYPDTPELRRYRREWLTRVVEPDPPRAPPSPTSTATADRDATVRAVGTRQ